MGGRNAILAHRMKTPSRSPLTGRPPKRKRTDAELHDLALGLGADWKPGDTVQTWINKHEGKTGELSRMVEDGWLWEDISKAMHLAGITYRTGQQIPSHTLRLKAYLARTRERERRATEATQQAGPHVLPSGKSAPSPVPISAIEAPARPVAASTRTETPPDAPDEGEGSVPEEPTFKLVTLKGGHQPPKPRPPPKSPLPERPATPKVSDEEILRRVFGKS